MRQTAGRAQRPSENSFSQRQPLCARRRHFDCAEAALFRRPQKRRIVTDAGRLKKAAPQARFGRTEAMLSDGLILPRRLEKTYHCAPFCGCGGAESVLKTKGKT
ncbi:hypothetical protein HMPREF9123_0349 [Neisseria bacilliformis ATCC BAA-1200]|uniref:Uncharacterized protein n=1 Tax=Neisseria bacilliformis ATCC BAA-1200 TaxID=888742 RepID=F2B9J3_9NEIS|nr:hypothetical protein HMPREF9123_0349 [Neisseria bacilliformis ATCC BAA-1200]